MLKLLAQKASTVEEAEKAMAIIAMNRTLSARVDTFHPVDSQVAAALMRVSGLKALHCHAHTSAAWMTKSGTGSSISIAPPPALHHGLGQP